jgi:hypothetical protein
VTYRTVHDSEEIEQIILARNAAHYSQAKETPFGKEPNRTLLGPDGTSDLSEAVLNGTYRPLLDPNTVSAETFLMLDQLKRTDAPPISPDIMKGSESGPKEPQRRHPAAISATIRAPFSVQLPTRTLMLSCTFTTTCSV